MHGLRRGHTYRSHKAGMEQGSQAHNSGRTTRRDRDEDIHTHSYVQTNAKSIKGYDKKVTEFQQQHGKGLTTHMDKHGKDDIRVGNYKDSATASSNTKARTSKASRSIHKSKGLPSYIGAHQTLVARLQERPLSRFKESSGYRAVSSQAPSKTRPDYKNGVNVSSNSKARTSIASRSVLKSKVPPSHTGACQTFVTRLQEWLPIAQLGRFQLQSTIDTSYDPVDKEMSKNGAERGWTTLLYRDEAIHIHSYVQAYVESSKGYGKKATKVKEPYDIALATAAANHRERRKYLHTTHKVLTGSDRPRLLGTKAPVEVTGAALQQGRDQRDQKKYQAKKGCQDQDGIGAGPGPRARHRAREAAGPGGWDDWTTGDQMTATYSHKFKL